MEVQTQSGRRLCSHIFLVLILRSKIISVKSVRLLILRDATSIVENLPYLRPHCH